MAGSIGAGVRQPRKTKRAKPTKNGAARALGKPGRVQRLANRSFSRRGTRSARLLITMSPSAVGVGTCPARGTYDCTPGSGLLTQGGHLLLTSDGRCARACFVLGQGGKNHLKNQAYVTTMVLRLKREQLPSPAPGPLRQMR